MNKNQLKAIIIIKKTKQKRKKSSSKAKSYFYSYFHIYFSTFFFGFPSGKQYKLTNNSTGFISGGTKYWFSDFLFSLFVNRTYISQYSVKSETTLLSTCDQEENKTEK